MEEWNASIYPNLLKPLFKDHTARLFRGAKKQCWYSITCWMVGDEWLLSHPAAIVISGDPKVTRNGVRLVEKHGQLSQFGYRVYEYESKILPSMAASLLGELNLTTRLCDMPITVGSDGTSARRATLGGVIILGEKYFGVTVLHPFIREDQTNPSTDDDHSALSDSDGEASSIDVNLQYGDIALDADTVYLQNSHSLMEYVGAIPRVSKSKYFSQHLDWALVELKSTPDLLLNFTIADGKVVVLSKVSTTLPRNLILTAMNPAAPIQAKVAPIIHGLFLPHSGLQDAWALNMKPREPQSDLPGRSLKLTDLARPWRFWYMGRGPSDRINIWNHCRRFRTHTYLIRFTSTVRFQRNTGAFPEHAISVVGRSTHTASRD
jgi:hypothetical protein